MLSQIGLIASFIALLAFECSANLSNAQQPASPQVKPSPSPTTKPITSHVVLISISGLGADLFQKNVEVLPFLHSIRKTGVACVSVDSVYPSATIPALATLVTGLLPADHGLFALPQENMANVASTKVQGVTSSSTFSLLRQSPLWETLKESKLITSAIGSPFELSNGSQENSRPMSTEAGTSIPSWPRLKNSALAKSLEQDRNNCSQAIALWEKAPPNLLWLHFSSLELSQDITGESSQETLAVLQTLNQTIQELINMIEKTKAQAPATVFIVGDHGMAHVEKELNLNVLFAKKGWLSVDASGHIADWKAIANPFGGSAAIFVKNPADEKELELLLRETYEKPDSPIWRVLTRQAISKLGGDSSAAYYVDAAPGYQISNATQGSLISKPLYRSNSGYLPQRTEMRTVLLAFGRGIKAGHTVEYVRLTDVAPTIAHLLGVKPKATRGRVLSEIIAP